MSASSPGEFLARNIDAATAYFEGAAGSPCRYDRDTVHWIEQHLATLRSAASGHREEAVPMFGALLGQCFAVSFDGTWARVNGGGLAVKIGDNVFVVPWDKVEGYLGGDDGDSLIGFFDFVARSMVGRKFDAPQIVT